MKRIRIHDTEIQRKSVVYFNQIKLPKKYKNLILYKFRIIESVVLIEISELKTLMISQLDTNGLKFNGATQTKFKRGSNNLLCLSLRVSLLLRKSISMKNKLPSYIKQVKGKNRKKGKTLKNSIYAKYIYSIHNK